MKRATANIFEPEWVEREQPPLIGRAARVGAQAGAERLGATLYEIDPGGAARRSTSTTATRK
jgi:hypothetical protein